MSYVDTFGKTWQSFAGAGGVLYFEDLELTLKNWSLDIEAPGVTHSRAGMVKFEGFLKAFTTFKYYPDPHPFELVFPSTKGVEYEVTGIGCLAVQTSLQNPGSSWEVEGVISQCMGISIKERSSTKQDVEILKKYIRSE